MNALIGAGVADLPDAEPARTETQEGSAEAQERDSPPYRIKKRSGPSGKSHLKVRYSFLKPLKSLLPSLFQREEFSFPTFNGD